MKNQGIRDMSVYILKNFKFSLWLHNSFFRLKNKNKFNAEIRRRKRLSICDYEMLSKPLPYYPIEAIKDANFYGHNRVFKSYANLGQLNHSIEHGLYLGNYVPKASFLNTTKSIITFSENRKEHLVNSGIRKPITVVGPYINYAEPLLDQDTFNQLKKKLGKTFLLFPSHSIKNFNVQFDIKSLIEKVKLYAKDYDTVLVCLYYQDILDGFYPKFFKNAGFQIVTAGHKLDLNFISRLKSIIMLADYTASNTVGTHTGYCIHLEKPHFIIKGEIEIAKKDGSPIDQYRNQKELDSFEIEKNEIRAAFTKPLDYISLQQKKIVNKYWGLNCIKSVEELRLELEYNNYEFIN